MGQTIKIDQLADTVMKSMEEYAKLAVEDLKKDVQKAGKTVKQQIDNLAQAIVKNADKTMKITYTLTEVESSS